MGFPHLTSMLAFPVETVAPNQCTINHDPSGFAWRKQKYYGSSGKIQTLVVLLRFPAVFCCFSRTLARPMAMSIHSRLEIQTAQPSGFFPSTGVPPGGWTQATFQRHPYDCQVYRCCPSSLAIHSKGVRTGLGSSIVGYEYTCQEYAPSQPQTTASLLHHPVLYPPCSHPSHLIVALLGVFVEQQPLSCSWFPSGSMLYSSRLPPAESSRQRSVPKQQGKKKTNNQLRSEPLVITIKFLLVILAQSSRWADCVLFLLLMSMI